MPENTSSSVSPSYHLPKALRPGAYLFQIEITTWKSTNLHTPTKDLSL